MSEPVIRKEQEQRKGRYAAIIEGIAGEAELVFTNRSPSRQRRSH